MAHLTDESVFFEPAGDKRYYEALGHEVAGDRELALAAWRAFLAEAPSSQYARRARAHLAELKRAPVPTSSIDPSRVRVTVGEIMDLRGLRSRRRCCARSSRSTRTSCGCATRACCAPSRRRAAS